jgi:hypothetical protein
VAATLPAVTPTNLSFLPMRPNTAWAPVPQLTWNWVPGPNPAAGDFTWSNDQQLHTPLSLHTTRLFQYGLLQAGGFGLPALRHDAPRRFRVAGTGIQPGARLVVHTPNDPTAPIPNLTPLNQMVTAALSMPLNPTNTVHTTGAPIWETSVELDPLTYYRMMLGGPFAKGVAAASTDWFSATAEPPQAPDEFDAATFNWHYVQVLNPGVPAVDLGWQRLTIQ